MLVIDGYSRQTGFKKARRSIRAPPPSLLTPDKGRVPVLASGPGCAPCFAWVSQIREPCLIGKVPMRTKGVYAYQASAYVVR